MAPAVSEAPHYAAPAVPEASRNAAPATSEARYNVAPIVPEVPHDDSPKYFDEDAEPASALPNPMIHLSEINARLTDFERKFINAVLRGQRGGELSNMLLTMSADDAAAFVKEQIAQVQAARAAANNAAAPPAEAPSRAEAPPLTEAPPLAEVPPSVQAQAPAKTSSLAKAPASQGAPLPTDARPPLKTSPVTPPGGSAPAEPSSAGSAASSGLADLMPHLLAGSAYLTAEERATVLWLVPRFPAARLEELKAKLLKMSPGNGAKWLRANLAALRAEVSS
jgi:hypothetical protein